MSSSLTWNAQKKAAPATTTPTPELAPTDGDVATAPVNAGIIAAFDDEITRLRAGLRTWPPASDQIPTGEHVVLLMRMREQLLRTSSGQGAAPAPGVEMSPASASAVGLSSMRRAVAVTGQRIAEAVKKRAPKSTTKRTSAPFDLTPTEDQQLIVEMLGRVAKEVLAPMAEEADDAATMRRISPVIDSRVRSMRPSTVSARSRRALFCMFFFKCCFEKPFDSAL